MDKTGQYFRASGVLRIIILQPGHSLFFITSLVLAHSFSCFFPSLSPLPLSHPLSFALVLGPGLLLFPCLLLLLLLLLFSHLYRNFLHFLLPLFFFFFDGDTINRPSLNGERRRRLRNDERFSIPGAKARGCLSSTEEPPLVIFGIFLIFLFPNTKGRNRVITREEENTKSKCDGGK